MSDAKKPQSAKNGGKGKNGKHAGGRPTLYRAEYATDEHTQGFVDYCKENKEVVTLCGYCVYVDVSDETLTKWKKAHPKFVGTLAKIKRIAKNQLYQGGLNKSLSSRIVKLGLSANHNMNEKSETEITGKDGGPVEIVNYAKAVKSDPK